MSLLKLVYCVTLVYIFLCVTILASEGKDKSTKDVSLRKADNEAIGQAPENSKPMLVQLKKVLKKLKHNIAGDSKENNEEPPIDIETRKSEVHVDIVDQKPGSKGDDHSQINPINILKKVELATFEQTNPIELQNTQPLKQTIEEQNESFKKTPELPPFVNTNSQPKGSKQVSSTTTENSVNFILKDSIKESASSAKDIQNDPSKLQNAEVLPSSNIDVLEQTSSLEIDNKIELNNDPDTVEDLSVAVPPDVINSESSGDEERIISTKTPDQIQKKDQPRADEDVLETYSQFAQRISAQKKNGDSVPQPAASHSKGATAKVKSKNYASQDCGAKLMGSNPEAKYADKIIDPSKDAYLLNECSKDTWVIIELCDAIRPQKFSIANFELFSNQPREIRVHGSYRFPTREWHLLGTYQGEERNRDIQSFTVETNEFVKYMKVEVISHYGSEFFCPLSLVQLHGISEYEVIDHLDYDADISTELEPSTAPVPNKVPWDLTMLVRSVLGLTRRGSVPENNTTELQDQSYFTNTCNSLSSSFAVQENECTIKESLNYIISCYGNEYQSLIENEFVKSSLTNETCQLLAHNLCSHEPVPDKFIYQTICINHYVCTMLSPRHVLAMCHMLRPDFLRRMTLCNTDSVVSLGDDISMFLNSSGQNKSLSAPKHLSGIETPSETQDKHDSANLDQQKTVEVIPPSNQTADSAVNKTKTVDSVKAKPEVNSSHSSSVSKETEETHQHMESKVSPPNKETIIVRLSNKIKMLDHNMSISNQYLEELSRRYKQQMEDLQRQINETNLSIDKTNQLVRTYHHNTSKRMDTIENKLDSLTQVVEKILLDKEDMMDRLLTHHLGFLVIQAILLSMLFICCSRRNQEKHSLPPIKVVDRKISNINSSVQQRRRRPSDCSLTISGNYQYLLRDPNSTNQSPATQRSADVSKCQDLPISSTILASSSGIELSETMDPSGVQQYIDEDKVPYFGAILDGRFYEFRNSQHVETVTPNYGSDFNVPVINDYYEQKSERSEPPWMSEGSIPPSPVPIANPLGSQDLFPKDNWQWYSRQGSPLPPALSEQPKRDVVDSVPPVPVQQPLPEKMKKRKKKKKSSVPPPR